MKVTITLVGKFRIYEVSIALLQPGHGSGDS
jgi:hypothetical protein